MAETRVLDFDAARAERRKTLLRAWEKDIPVPGSPPLAFVMLTDQLKQDQGDDYQPSFAELGELVKAALGEDVYEWIMTHAAEQDDLEWIMEAVMGSWGMGDDEEGEAEAPDEGAGSDTAGSTGDS